jgi:hypothetical protein
MSVLDELTVNQKKELAKLALESASELGYCSESRNVIENMGLINSDDLRVKKVVTLEVEIEYDFGHELDSDQFEVNYYGDTEDSYIESVNVVKEEDR